jgi:hypothetical protein
MTLFSEVLLTVSTLAAALAAGVSYRALRQSRQAAFFQCRAETTQRYEARRRRVEEIGFLMEDVAGVPFSMFRRFRERSYGCVMLWCGLRTGSRSVSALQSPRRKGSDRTGQK